MEICKSFIHLIFAMLILMPGGFLICYAVSQGSGNVKPLPNWPFISDLGNEPPESGLFTLFLTLGAFVMFVMQSLYYKYVIRKDGQSKTNIAAVVVGSISCFGVTMVSSFQWKTILVPHVIGATLAFVGSVVYSWLVVVISWRQMVPHVHGKSVVYIRIVIAIMQTLSSIIYLVFFCLFQVDRMSYYLNATISEWVFIYSTYVYLTTLGFDLCNIRTFSLHLTLYR